MSESSSSTPDKSQVHKTSADNASTDICQRFLFADADVRGEIVRLTRSYTDTVSNHAYPPAVSSLLGEFLAAGVLMGSAIKYDGRLVLQVRGDGELNLIMAECTSEGAIRGIARFDVAPESADFDALTGNGVLVITVDSRHADPYQGIVSLEGESLAASLQTYFAQSEQLQSWFYFAVDEDQACGFMIQQLPGASGSDADAREESWQHLLTLAQTLTPSEMLALSNAELLHRLYHQEEVKLFPPRQFHYQCSCSRERTARALISIGKEEVDSIVAEQGAVSIACEFCGTDYRFDASEIALLFQDRGDLIH
ncbi:MAG: Hsp33 family molecular chaperone HslO [Pseudohongiella sp.]|uniref:Hsp33 family molecular chaperone HslO n=1 Tax=Pseudohongiella sp. TaxID=1979412 RepID=UPI0034A07CE6